jgi:photosystem II stability/assembly factor-like uncharacterized protein
MKRTFALLFFLICLITAFGQNTDNNGRRVRNLVPHNITPPHRADAGNPWVSIGPFGGDCIDLTSNPEQPGSVFAAAGTPFVSADGGDTWAAITSLSGLAGGAVNAIKSASNGVLLATGMYSYGKVFRSLDGGITWQSRLYPVNVSGLCIAMDPNDTNTMYVGLASLTTATQNKVIVKSINGGTTWTAIDMTSVFPVGYSVENLCVDPSNSLTIFATARTGFSDCLVAASFDGGTTWTDRTGNLPAGKPYNDVTIGNQTVYVAGGQLFGSQYMGVYKSTDYGITWTNISASFPNQVSNAVVINPSDPDNLYVATEGDGIYSTTDGGATWNFNTNGAGANGAARALLFKPGDPSTIYAGYLSLAVCRSTDSGESWEYANSGIATLTVDDVERDPLDPGLDLVGFEAENSGGCFLTLDTGATWSLVTGLPGTRFSKVGFTSDGALLAWSNGPTTVAQEGLYKSTDNGVTWNNMGPNIGSLLETEIFSLAASAINPNLIFIGGNNFGVNGWASVIWRTTDGGQTWDNVYVGSFPDNFESVRYLWIDPNSSDQVIYAAMKSEVEGSLLKSSDGGDTWDVISGSIPASYKWYGTIVSMPDDSQKLLAGAGGYGVTSTAYLSADAGNTWTHTNLALGTYSQLQDLMVNPEDPDVIYGASQQDGVYLSYDGGMNWVAANDGLPAGNVTAFSNPWPSGSTWRFMASTFGNSVFETSVSTPGTGITSYGNPQKVRVYPNPARDYVRIESAVPSVRILRVELSNSRGELLQVTDGRSQGTADVRFHLPDGIYFCRIVTDSGTETAKVLVSR